MFTDGLSEPGDEDGRSFESSLYLRINCSIIIKSTKTILTQAKQIS